MKCVAILAILVLAGCKEPRPISTTPQLTQSTQPLTYRQLVNYPIDCAKKNIQLAELKELQEFKNFPQDSDSLNIDARAYNGRLKATIWWYSYSCGDEL
jgi:PBP1b-binding outer membrane lipoprotein LpoB